MGVDTHIIMVATPGGAVPTPTPMPFHGKLSAALSATTFIDNMAAAVEGSGADNSPAHVPAGGPFQKQPSNKGTIDGGSSSVFFDDKAAARMGDPVKTCSDPKDGPNGVVIAAGTVLIG